MEYKTVDLSIFPIIHAVIHQVSISIPEKGEGTIKTLNIIPKILPLFIGKFLIDKIRIESPDMKMVMPRSFEQSNEAKEPFNLDTFKDTVIGMLSPLTTELQEFQITIKDGAFNLIEEAVMVFTLRNVQAEIGCLSQEIKIKINGTSSICKDISVIASFGQKDLKGKGEVELRHFQPQTLFDRFLPDAVYRISEPIDKVIVNLKTDGPNDLQVGLKGSLPNLTLRKGDMQSVIKCKNMEGSLHFEEGKTKISLTDLDLDQPQLNMIGDFVVDHETQQINLELTGRDIDIPTVREKALAFAGDNEVVKTLFQILKGGRLPDIVIRSQGRSFGDLGNMENLVIKGNIREGKILIPGPDFILENVTGDLVVEQGILEGTKIDAKLKDAFGREGRISVGLTGKDAPLHVETKITTDAEQIPPLLKRLTKNKNFLSAIKRLINVKGTVTGTLVIGGRLDAITAKVDIDRINVSAHYDGVPFPLQINDGRVHYDGENISMTNLGGTFGSSLFSELTAGISLGEDASIEIQSGRILALLKELYPWVYSFEKVEKGLKDVKAVSGILRFSSLKLHGPLAMPESWSIEATGEVEDLIVDTTLFPESIKIEKGNLKAVENKILLTAAKVNAGDSSLRISATVNHHMTEFVKVDIGFEGEMGKESMNWIENRFKLPAEFSIRPPLSIPEAHLTWKKDSGISFISTLVFQDGPGISFDMFLNAEGLKINNILIQDAETNASFACGLKEEVIDFSFTGNLSHTTTDKIFHNTPFSKEWIKGDFEAHILLDKPKHSIFHGILEGGDFSFPWIQKVPLNINDIALHADNKSVMVDSLRLTWKDNHLSVNGDVNISENGFLFDLVMSADGINWDTIRKTLDIGNKKQDKNEDNKKKEEESEESHFWELPIKGFLRLDAESFTFDQYTWEPLQAKLSFDPDCISIEVIDANVCGTSCPGVLEVTPQDISLDFQLQSRNQELSTTIQCFGDKNDFITGELHLEAQAMARGASKELVKSLNGNFEGTAKNGKISRFGLLAKIFAFLNLTETFRGKLPGITKEGFPYKSMTLNGEIQNGLFMINEYVLDAPSMRVTSHGSVDIFANELDLELLMSPFKTVDFIINNIPIIRGILGGTLVSIPVKVKGDIENPMISYFPFSVVGRKLLNTTKRALNTPANIIKPLIPGKGKK
ncbi:hypothetical protein SCALIN_C13_0210 [Candidatus Scalindua japonica]|uniref:YhdP central domain-containing protein n=1 Tax=Candidatus Scalindua japonica TaxID=1284222 RepID=A0A286TXT0_9BACT|nr:hypothetical protein SCALIN_C13_0210 [Candidatus Scalindua japonica]